jgi:hypothetical protein
MEREDMCEVEKIVERLKADGWREQMAGMTYVNGTLGTNLLKNGEVITVQQEFSPDEEFLEQEWPTEEEDVPQAALERDDDEIETA